MPETLRRSRAPFQPRIFHAPDGGAGTKSAARKFPRKKIARVERVPADIIAATMNNEQLPAHKRLPDAKG
ncbi:MAG: hypothetical protein ACI4P3_05550, partial [Candidatus Spyradosoma sp.]